MGGMKMILQERFRANVQRMLNSRGWSKADLARRMAVDGPYIHQYMRDEGRSPGMDVIERFASAFEVDPVELLLEDAQKLQTLSA